MAAKHACKHQDSLFSTLEIQQIDCGTTFCLLQSNALIWAGLWVVVVAIAVIVQLRRGILISWD